MKFDLKQLQAFVTLADTANYREAANRLFITQPALTKQIQGLEQTLGSTLFNRRRTDRHRRPAAHPGECPGRTRQGL